MSAGLAPNFRRSRLRRGLFLIVVALILATRVGATWAGDPPQRLKPGRASPISPNSRSSDGRSVTIRVPLEDGRFYRLNDLQRAVRDANGKIAPDDEKADRRCEITPAERALLLLLDGHRLKVEFADDHLTLTFRHRDRASNEKSPLPSGDQITVWPKGTGLHVPASFDSTRHTCLTIHGFNATSSSFGPFASRCREANIQVIAFDYPSNASILSAAKRLSSDLRDLGKKYPRLRLAVVAHSLGGLVARAALELVDPRLNCVTDVFLSGHSPAWDTSCRTGKPAPGVALECRAFRGWSSRRKSALAKQPGDCRFAPNSALCVDWNVKLRPMECSTTR